MDHNRQTTAARHRRLALTRVLVLVTIFVAALLLGLVVAGIAQLVGASDEVDGAAGAIVWVLGALAVVALVLTCLLSGLRRDLDD